MTQKKITTALEAVLSPEYKAALAAQIDYDSTGEGQAILDEMLQSATSPEQARHIMARKLAGAYSSVARGEQVAMMPPVVQRGRPGYKAYHAIAKTREQLARDIGCAAAEANAWTKVSPVTTNAVRDHMDAIRAHEVELGLDLVLWRHPHLFATAGPEHRAPWLGSSFTRPADVGDVIKLMQLGMNAVYRDGKVYATGNPDAIFRWGYFAELDGDVAVVKTAPDLRAWHKAKQRAERGR